MTTRRGGRGCCGGRGSGRSPMSSRRCRRFVIGEGPQPLLQRHREFEASEVRTEAAMDPEPERDVAVLRPVDPELVRGVECLRVLVGGAERERCLLAGVDRAPGDLGVRDHLATHRDGAQYRGISSVAVFQSRSSSSAATIRARCAGRCARAPNRWHSRSRGRRGRPQRRCAGSCR